MTRTITETFAPAISNANRLNYLHKRIKGMSDRSGKALLIHSMFRSGRINGTDMWLLLDVYVREDQPKAAK